MNNEELYAEVKRILLEHVFAVADGRKSGYSGMSHEDGIRTVLELIDAIEDGATLDDLRSEGLSDYE